MNDKNIINRPNVIAFVIDDYRDFVGCFATHPDVRTPNIDSLAKRGVTFSSAHCQAPMCGPSRASFLSGIRPSTSGCYGFQPMRSIPLLNDLATIPKHFRSNAYHVMGTGKVHHGNPTQGHGPHVSEWDEYWPSIENPVINSNPEINEALVTKVNKNFKYGPTDTIEEHCSDAQHARWAVKQLERQFTQPFFLGVGFYRPHLPFVCPQKYFDYYDINTLNSIFVKNDDLDNKPDAGRFLSKYILDDTIRDRAIQLEILQAYLACVSYMDAQVGKVLNALENSDYKDNTIVVFLSDNGWHFGEKLTWTKFTLWKEATRVPLIVAGPGIQKGITSLKPVGLIDLYPTLLELCGLPQPAHQLEGKSFYPLLTQADPIWEHGVVTTYGRDNHCITTERWKYIRYFDGSEELYDRASDNYEWINLIGQGNDRQIISSLEKWLPSVNVPNAPGTTLAMCFSTDYPDLNRWRQNKAKWKDERGEVDAAISLYQDAIAHLPKQPLWIYLRCSTLLIGQSRTDDAIKILKSAIKIYPRQTRAYAALGYAYADKGNSSEAVRLLQKAFSLNSNTSEEKVEQEIRSYWKNNELTHHYFLLEIAKLEQAAFDEDYFISDWCKVRRQPEATDVLLVFSPIGFPLQKFSASNALKGLNINIIFLNCDNTWYLNGVEGLGQTLAQTLERLQQLIQVLTQGIGRVFTYGGSMGAYGAVLYGCLLDVNRVIAAGAELIFWIQGGNTNKISKLRKAVSQEIFSSIDIKNIIENSKAKVSLYCGENFYPDLMCALSVQQLKNVHLHTLRNLGHSVPPYLNKEYGFRRFLGAHIEAKDEVFRFQFTEHHEGDIFQYPDLIKNLFRIFFDSQNLDKDNYDNLVQTFKIFCKGKDISANAKSHANFGMAEIYSMSKDTYYDAISHCERAINLNPQNVYFHKKLVELNYKYSQYEQALLAANHAIELDIQGWNLDVFDLYVVRIKVLIVLHQYDSARASLSELRERYPTEANVAKNEIKISEIEMRIRSSLGE